MELISPTNTSFSCSSFSPSVLNCSFFDDFVSSFDAPQGPVVQGNVQSVVPQQPTFTPVPIASLPVPKLSLPAKVTKKASATVAVTSVPPATPTKVAGWTNESCNQAKIKNVEDITTILKKRGEDNVLTGKSIELYQPYRYQLVTEVNTSAFSCPVQTLLYCVQVVDAETNEEVLKGTSKIIQNGDGFHSMNLKSSTVFKSELRVLFLDCSYHHSGRPFALKVSYFLNNELESPCLVRISPAFRVIARPPDRGGVKNNKRKKASSSDDDDEEVSRPAKKKKINTTASAATCETFMAKFDALLESSFRPLSVQEQQRAIQQLMVRLYQQTNQAFAAPQKESDEIAELANLL